MYDAVVIGAGVVGCAIAQRLAEYQGRFAVVDRADDVSQGPARPTAALSTPVMTQRPAVKRRG